MMIGNGMPGSAPPSKMISSSTAIAIIWSLFFILLVTILARYYALHITFASRPNCRRRGSSSSSCNTPSPFQTRLTTTLIFLVLIFTTLHTLGSTFTIVWQDRLDSIMRGTLIHAGGNKDAWIREAMTPGGESMLLRERILKVSLAGNLVYIAVLWLVKATFLVVYWGVGRKLRDEARRRSLSAMNHHATAKATLTTENPTTFSTSPSTDIDNSHIEKQLPPVPVPASSLHDDQHKKPSRLGMITRASLAYYTLHFTTLATLTSYLAISSFQAVIGGSILGRSLTTYDVPVYKISTEIMYTTIITALGNIPTDILLLLTPLLLFRALHLNPSQMRGAWFIFAIGASTLVVACVRVGIMVAYGNGKDGAAMAGGWESVERGLDVKVFTSFELVLAGVVSCGPGLRAMVRGYSSGSNGNHCSNGKKGSGSGSRSYLQHHRGRSGGKISKPRSQQYPNQNRQRSQSRPLPPHIDTNTSTTTSTEPYTPGYDWPPSLLNNNNHNYNNTNHSSSSSSIRSRASSRLRQQMQLAQMYVVRTRERSKTRNRGSSLGSGGYKGRERLGSTSEV